MNIRKLNFLVNLLSYPLMPYCWLGMSAFVDKSINEKIKKIRKVLTLDIQKKFCTPRASAGTIRQNAGVDSNPFSIARRYLQSI